MKYNTTFTSLDKPILGECDRCGRYRLEQDLQKEYTGAVVCIDTCLEERHPVETARVPHRVITLPSASALSESDLPSCATTGAIVDVCFVGCAVVGTGNEMTDYVFGNQ